MTKTAIITGVTGQDGRYLVRLLHERGYKVVGTTRDPGAGAKIADLAAVELVTCPLTDEAGWAELVERVRPSEIYNLAAYSTGAGMFDEPVGIGEINGLGVTRILEAIRRTDPAIRFCQASSSELYGERSPAPQNELTPFHPRSPYGAAKLYAHSIIDVYRRRHGIHACSAILFNHESPLRSTAFVTRKVTRGAAAIRLGIGEPLALGNLESRRDWGFAGDTVRAMWLMLQAPQAEDFVVATGRSHSVRDLCALAFECVGLDYRDHVREDANAFRPMENVELLGDPSKARERLGWVAEVSFPELIRMMVEADLDQLRSSDH